MRKFEEGRPKRKLTPYCKEKYPKKLFDPIDHDENNEEYQDSFDDEHQSMMEYIDSLFEDFQNLQK